MLPIRIRDFIRDDDDWLYAVAAYDNDQAVGCVLRYIPDPTGDRRGSSGTRYRKVNFDEAFSLIREKKPAYAGLVHRVPKEDIKEVLKPDKKVQSLATEDDRVARLIQLFGSEPGIYGVTGSMLCGLAGPDSDIDGVVYGRHFLHAQHQLQEGIKSGVVEDLDDRLWKNVYAKRNPDLSYEEFLIQEQRKWNRGQIDGTYFDLLYSRGYEDLPGFAMKQGTVLGKKTIEAVVTGDEFAFDSPAIYEVNHPEISRVLSFTHTYTGQAFIGERIEARGIIEQHGAEQWLIVGTTREARGEFIRSLSLLEKDL
ncbi:MAG TPA: DNA polymerase subunit beta [Methanospirillum sp.]|nr:DNA polymerase subunit beta [Methanospirillum sp.]